MLALPLALALAQACAPAIAPETLLSVAAAESRLDPLAIGVNGPAHRALHPSSPGEAARMADSLAAEGADIDLGLAQINIRTARRLGLSLPAAFDPCRNLAAEAQVLRDGYAGARARGLAEQPALQAALSAYNTGDPQRGVRNGYVARVLRTANVVVPALALTASDASGAPDPASVRITALADRPVAPPATTAPPQPDLDVFAAPSAAQVWPATPLAEASRPPVAPLPPAGDRP